jgi:hypothetical protein
MSLILPPAPNCAGTRQECRQFNECSRTGDGMAVTYHDEVIIKVRANLDSRMVTRLFTNNPTVS